MKCYPILFLSLQLAVFGPVSGATLENDAIRLEADSNSGALSVTLKATGRQWKPGVPSTLTAEKPLALADKKIVGTLEKKGEPAFGVELELGQGAEVIVRVQPRDQLSKGAAVLYPPAFDSEAGEEIALPNEEGVLLPVTGAEEMHKLLQGDLAIYRQMGVSAGFAGVCDPGGKREGYAMLVRTPDDAAFRIVSGNDRLAPQVVWKPSMGALAYGREMVLQFFPQGGHTAIATAYRADQLAHGKLVSLRDKIKANPKIERAIGGPQIWLFADGVSLDLLHEMHDAGIDRGFICLPINNLVPPVKGESFEQEMNRCASHIPKGWFEELNRLGYLAGVYIEHFDMSPPDAAPLTLTRDYPPSYWPEAGILEADGRRKIGFAGKGMRVCTSLGNAVAAERHQILHALWPAMNWIFIDVDGALELMESYDQKHPMTRREDVTWRSKRLGQPACDYGWAVATEGGMDWCLPYVFAGQGLMTLTRFYGGMVTPGSPYYDGGWAGEQGRPPIMLRRIPAPPIYARYNLGPNYRAPLYELAAHDSIIQTWRWNDNSFKIEGQSRRKDLFSILYGTVPMWILDKPTWRAHQAEFVASYKDVCGWHRQIGLEPMMAHGFLTEDRMVQYSTFGNGFSVVVNFTRQPWSGYGVSLPAEGFLTFESVPAWLAKANNGSRPPGAG